MAILWYRRGEIAWLRNDPVAAQAHLEHFLVLAPKRSEVERADARVKLEVLARMR